MDNRDQLIDAVARLLSDATTFTLTELADCAGVSRATTYRNFSAPSDAIDAFISRFLTDFEIEVTALPHGKNLERLVGLCRAWARLVDDRSQALVHVRSADGFLTRAKRDDPIIGRIHRLVRVNLADAMAAGALPESDLDYAVFLWNLLLDPRELADLAEHLNTSIPRAAEQLTTDYLTILRSKS
jgi:hypothetical protein